MEGENKDKINKKPISEDNEKIEEAGSISIKLNDELKEELPDSIAKGVVDKLFPMIWSKRKYELKDMSRKESCEEMFYLGALNALSNLFEGEIDPIEDDEDFDDNEDEDNI